jgi:hypothetical protein
MLHAARVVAITNNSQTRTGSIAAILPSFDVLTLNPSLTITRGTRWPIAAAIAWTGTFSYLESKQFKRNAVTAAISVGRSAY